MAHQFVIKEMCSTCGGSGIQPIPLPGSPITCFMCEGTGTRETGRFVPDVTLATEEMIGDLKEEILDAISLRPTSAQMLQKFNQLQADIDLLKTGVQAIWNKVKDL